MPYDKENFVEYPLKGIPRDLWTRVKMKSRKLGISMRVFVLEAIREKLEGSDE